MKRITWGTLVPILAAGVALVTAQRKEPSANDKRVIELERSVLTAFVKGDAAGFKQHIASDAFGIDAMAGVVRPADWEKLMKDYKVQSWDIDSIQVHWITSETAMVTYRWTGKGTFMGQPLPSPTWASSLWVNRSGQWKSVFHQESVPPPAPTK